MTTRALFISSVLLLFAAVCSCGLAPVSDCKGMRCTDGGAGGGSGGGANIDGGDPNGGTGDGGGIDGGRDAGPRCYFRIENRPYEMSEGSVITVSMHEPDIVYFDARNTDGGNYPFGVSGAVGLSATTRYVDYLSYAADDGRSFRSTPTPTMVVLEQPRCPGDWFAASFGGTVASTTGTAVRLSDGFIASRVCYYPHGQPLPAGCDLCRGFCYPDCR